MSTKSSMWVPHFRTHQSPVSPPPIGLPLSDNIPYPLPPPALVLPRNSLLTCMAGWRALHEEWGDLYMTSAKLSNVYNPLPSCNWQLISAIVYKGSLYLPLHRYIVPYTSFKFQLVATGMQGFASICSQSDRHARVELTRCSVLPLFGIRLPHDRPTA